MPTSAPLVSIADESTTQFQRMFNSTIIDILQQQYPIQ